MANEHVDIAFQQVLGSISPEQPSQAVEIDGLRATLSGIIGAYDMALKDPRTVIPTPLSLVIEAARASVHR